MRLRHKLGLFGSLVVAAFAVERDASACGGCFVPPQENTQVTGHRMIMSIGMTQASLYDQIEYTGSPESFAWVLPIKGKVDVGVSSDIVFAELGADTSVSVAPPPLQCPAYNCYYGKEADGPNAGGMSAASGSGGGAPGVDVIAQQVVGPYETVQLASSDPQALDKWLADHGYQLPAEIEPIVAAYVKDGFDFLAVKLVPGKDVQAMQPIRITTQGSSVALPLRMVAAGTGATTTITLFVLSDFRAETANFPNFTIAPESVLWDWDNGRSNFTDLRDAEYKATKGFGWLTESAQPYSPFGLRNRIEQVAQVNTANSGYGTDPQKAFAAAKADMDALFAGIDENGAWVTRLRADLSRQALGTDLVLQAAKQQTEVPRYIQATKAIGTPPECPPVPPGCDPNDPNAGGNFWDGGVKPVHAGGRACAMSARPDSDGDAVIAASLFAIGLVALRRRRK